MAVFEKMGGRGNLALKKGDSVIKYTILTYIVIS